MIHVNYCTNTTSSYRTRYPVWDFCGDVVVVVVVVIVIVIVAPSFTGRWLTKEGSSLPCYFVAVGHW